MADVYDDAWIETYTGRKVWPLEPTRPGNEFYIDDIAHALSNLCRYTGHCKSFFSVAEHCVVMSRQVPQAFALEALLHDASEAYLADVSRPIKSLLPGYKQAEAHLDLEIRRAFGLPAKMALEVKEADLRMLATERPQLFAVNNVLGSLEGVESYPVTLQCLTPKDAEYEFLYQYKVLIEQRRGA